MRTAVLALALLLLPGVALAKGLSPEAAAAKRAELEAERSTSPRAAIEQLGNWGDEFGDPELFLSAATLAHDEAASSRDLDLAIRASELASTAADIGLYLADQRNYDATDWRPVTRERADELASEAQALARRSDELAKDIEAERAAAEAEAKRKRDAPVDEPRERRPGTGLIAGGSVALVIGAGGIGMLTAGLVMGQSSQREAEALMLPAQLDELDTLDRKGATANAIAYAGGAVAGVGIIVGATLIAVGVKRRKASPDASAARPTLLVDGWFDRDGGGLVLRGRF
jgi:outer membrane murein-binding lipoprotein Lpp